VAAFNKIDKITKGLIMPETSSSETSSFEQFFKQFSRALPGLPQDLEKNLRAATNAAFARLDLVTREEFDVQAAVLARTRAKVEALEARVAALEQAAGITTPPPLMLAETNPAATTPPTSV
jgi:ubiquinone biosynthesis accessory factor UbiK